MVTAPPRHIPVQKTEDLSELAKVCLLNLAALQMPIMLHDT